MSETFAIEYLHELEFRWKDFDALSDDQKAAFSIACFAVSEVNALTKIYAYSQHELTGQTAIDYGVMIQSHSVLRSWSAKLFEFSEFIYFRGRDNRTTDATLLSISKRHVETFKKLRDDKGYSAARYLRHETTNHYLLSPVRKNLEFVSENANCNFYVHQMTGNSYYPMGDEVVFAARMSREGGHSGTVEEKLRVYKNWWQWNLAATTWLHGVHFDLYNELIKPIAKTKFARRKDYWISPSLVGTPEERKIPLFMRRQE